MFLTDRVDDSREALARYRDALCDAFDAPSFAMFYADELGGPLGHRVNLAVSFTTLVHETLEECSRRGADLQRLLVRALRWRAGRARLVDALAPVLGLAPVIDLADRLSRSSCPASLREEVAEELAGALLARRSALQETGRAAWIDVLVWLEEQPEGLRPRPLLLEYLERIEQRWRATHPTGADALRAWLEARDARPGETPLMRTPAMRTPPVAVQTPRVPLPRVQLPTSERAPATEPPRKHVILFLAANPSTTSQLALDRECAAIERELRMSLGRDDFELRSRWAVSIDDLMRHLNELQPVIVHFSGHGGGATPATYGHGCVTRDVRVAAPAGIQLEDEQRQPQHVSARALGQMIGAAAPSVRLVVLNACYTDVVADALREVVDCVVGMRGAIGDDAARSFAVGFYRALGYRRSVGNAMKQAVAAMAAKQLPDELLPVCRTRDDADADQVQLPRFRDE